MLLIGVQPEEVVNSDAWYQTNEGLLYKDIELVYSQCSTYTGWLLYVKLRNRRGIANTRNMRTYNSFAAPTHV